MKISIIIPVYNVVPWLDECFSSIKNQSFTDFEVIVVDDGSTDGSAEKCDEWGKLDSRFRVIHKENEGPSIARNMGIKAAQGEYLSFIDSDDWIETEFLNKLYESIVVEDADMAECDVYRLDSRTGKKAYRTSFGNLGVAFTKEEHMKYGYTTLWKCLIRKNIFDIYNIEFPDCHSESKAIYPLLIALCDKVVNVREPLYNYRQFRPNSLTATPRKNDGDENAVGLRAFDALIQGFEANKIADKYSRNLQEIITYKLSDMLSASFHRKTREDYANLLRNYEAYLNDKFPDVDTFSYISLGGYNLSRIMWDVRVLHDASCRFNFSSIISIMQKVKVPLEMSHKNKYREIMVRRDIYSEFWDNLEQKKPKYIFLDFIEERFDVCQYGGGYITVSDAYAEATNNPDGLMLKRDSVTCDRLWKECCNAFVNKIREEYSDIKFVLIKNYLSEYVGDVEYKEVYAEINSIRKINKMLQEYYSYFEMNCPDATIIDLSKDEFYFTDKNYEYGSIPAHLNEIVNRRIARKIEEKLGL